MGNYIFNGNTTTLFGGNTTELGGQDLFGKPISKSLLDIDVAEELVKPLASVTIQNAGVIGGDGFGTGIENASILAKGAGGARNAFKNENGNALWKY